MRKGFASARAACAARHSIDAAIAAIKITLDRLRLMSITSRNAAERFMNGDDFSPGVVMTALAQRVHYAHRNICGPRGRCKKFVADGAATSDEAVTQSRGVLMKEMFGNLIGGAWRGSQDAIANVNPSDTSDIVGHYAVATAVDVNEAVSVARDAGRAWFAATPQDRSDRLDAIGTEIAKRGLELARQLA